MNQLDPAKVYPVEIKDVGDLCGFTLAHARKGGALLVQRKAFLTSYDPVHSEIIGNCLSPIVSDYRNLNELLVVIRENQAAIYRNFPLRLTIRAKGEIKQLSAVFRSQILDIVAAKFDDDIFKLDIRDGDKFVWLFRCKWNFGLYFDYTRELKVGHLYSELGECYRKLEYFHLYSFLSAEPSFAPLIARGWFPFAQLLGGHFESLLSCAEEDLDIASETITEAFGKEKILGFVQYWWRNPIFAEKRALLMAGIEAYFQPDSSSVINCIKNLVTEIEGIIRLDYHKQYGKRPTTEELKTFVLERARRRFNTDESLGFPGLFYRYLDEVIFRGFDVSTGDIPFSRHTIGHGVASPNLFSRTRALQLILTVDQIHFYLGEDGPALNG